MSKAFTSEETPDEPPLVRLPAPLEPGETRYVTPEGRRALEAEAARLREAGQGARADALSATLAQLTTASPEPSPAGRAVFGRWVTVEDEDGRRARYRLVGPDEADARRGLVNAASPLGRALLGKRAGDVAVVERPRGASELTVVAVE